MPICLSGDYQSIVLQFGSGDIGIQAKWGIKDGERLGLIGFSQGEPGEIGREVDVEGNGTVVLLLDSVPVINTLIEQLTIIKTFMEESE